MTTTPLTTAEELVLQAVNEFHALTSEQLRRLLYGNSIEHARKRLHRLQDLGYLDRKRLPLPEKQEGGGTYRRYWLTAEGKKYLKWLGITPKAVIPPSEEAGHQDLFVKHEVGVNDVLIAATLLAKRGRRVRVLERKHERELRRSPVEVRIAGRKARVAMDGWVRWLVDERFEVCFGLEYDRGTEDQAYIRDKVRKLAAMTEGRPSPYTEHFRSESLVIGFVAEQGRARAEQLLDWIEVELAASGLTSYAGLFLVTGSDPTADYEDFFCGRNWVRPFGDSPEPLLELEDSGA
jgi:hypothetical protein